MNISLFFHNILQRGYGMIVEELLERMMESEVFFDSAVVFFILYYVFLTIAQYKLFIKAGEKGWKALIPFYSIFVSHHLIGMSHIWFILDIVFWAGDIIIELIGNVPHWLDRGFFSVAIILTIISEIIHIAKLCYCYTKSELFGIGLFVFPPLFSMILAFDGSEYNPPLKHKEQHEKNKGTNQEHP